MADPLITLYITDTLGLTSRTYTLTGMAGNTFFPTIQGSGDAELFVQFGPLVDPLFGLPAPGVPLGPFPGVIAPDGSFAKLSSGAAFNFGSATLIGDVGVSFPTVYGMTQSPTGYASGAWFFQATVISVDVFSSNHGIGWGRAYNGGAGLDPNHWAFNGGYAGADPNGGGMIHAGGFNTYTPTMGTQGVARETFAGRHMGVGSTFGAAIFLPAFVNLATFDPQKLVPVDMPCLPCCPIDACLA